MAYCNQTLGGITLDCTSSLGGIKTVYIANYGDVESVDLVSGTTGTDAGKITGITMADGVKFKPYQFRKQTGSMTSTLTVDENGMPVKDENGENVMDTTYLDALAKALNEIRKK